MIASLVADSALAIRDYISKVHSATIAMAARGASACMIMPTFALLALDLLTSLCAKSA
jgi:hypothetical protein